MSPSQATTPKATARRVLAHDPNLTVRAVRLSPWLVLRAILHIIKYSVMLSCEVQP